MVDKKVLKFALKSCVPVIFGYLPTGFAFGLMLTAAGYSIWIALAMSLFVYAGASQYLALEFFISNSSLLSIGIITFLINSKHLFYGLSLLGDYKDSGRKKPYLIFSLTDETYALLTQPKVREDIDRAKYCFYVSFINHCAWFISTVLGALLGSFLQFDVRGMEFAMTALFVVILIEQLKVYKTKLPFVVGICCAVIALLLVGKANMLLVGSILSGISMLVLRKKVVQGDS